MLYALCPNIASNLKALSLSALSLSNEPKGRSSNLQLSALHLSRFSRLGRFSPFPQSHICLPLTAYCLPLITSSSWPQRPREIHPIFFPQLAFIFSIYGLHFVGDLLYKTNQLFEKTSK
jgi:hypothetical protein